MSLLSEVHEAARWCWSRSRSRAKAIVPIAAGLLILTSIVVAPHPASAEEAVRFRVQQTWEGLSAPAGIAVTPDGSLAVVDHRTHQLEYYAADGSQSFSHGTRGAAGGTQFDSPGAVAVSKDGIVYVADTANHRVQLFRLNRGRVFFRRTWGEEGDSPGRFRSPAGIAVRGERVYVIDTGNHRIQIFNRIGNFIAMFGRLGRGEGEFRHPSAITVDDEGNLYVTDTDNDRVQKFTSNGRFLGEWTGAGTPLGALREPVGICHRQGTIYVAERSAHRIRRFTSNGQSSGALEVDGGEPLFAPEDLSYWNRGDQLVVSEPWLGRARRLAPTDEETDAPSAPAPARVRLATGSGERWATSSPGSNTVRIFDVAGARPRPLGILAGDPQQRSADAVFSLTGVALGPPDDNRIYLVDAGRSGFRTRLHCWRMDPERIRFVRSVDLETLRDHDSNVAALPPIHAGAVRVSPRGQVFVLDPIAARVLIFDRDLRFVDHWGGYGMGQDKFRRPVDLAFSADGAALFVLDQRRGRVQSFRPTGEPIVGWGAAGGGEGELRGPSSIAVQEGGKIVVADTGNSRVQFFRPNGEFVHSWPAPAPPSSVTWIANDRWIALTEERGYLLSGSGETVDTFALDEGGAR